MPGLEDPNSDHAGLVRAAFAAGPTGHLQPAIEEINATFVMPNMFARAVMGETADAAMKWGESGVQASSRNTRCEQSLKGAFVGKGTFSAHIPTTTDTLHRQSAMIRRAAEGIPRSTRTCRHDPPPAGRDRSAFAVHHREPRIAKQMVR